MWSSEQATEADHQTAQDAWLGSIGGRSAPGARGKQEILLWREIDEDRICKALEAQEGRTEQAS